ncbi:MULTISPECIES: site-specific integrase [Paraburkholderia]|uniref:site-specific integrase n=1 Tax=Paraburkholderia TaxID=1822464 RepID=UPI0028A5BCA6|nr:site-specific integrase [Paraburkholderia podalyriae]
MTALLKKANRIRRPAFTNSGIAQQVTGKGKRVTMVALPPLSWEALSRYLAEQGLPILPAQGHPQTPVIGSLEPDSAATISGVRLWSELKRFFFCWRQRTSRQIIRLSRRSCAMPAPTGRATPTPLMRSAATPNRRQCGTTCGTRPSRRRLHSDEVKRARQIGEAFATGKRS